MQSNVLSQRFDVHQAVTEKIIKAIEAGAGDYVMPWHRIAPAIGRPANAVSRTPYKGVNVVALWAESILADRRSGWWATFKQWKELGAQVRRGEHGTTIVFYKSLAGPSVDEDERDNTARLVARAYRVFNHDQVDGWIAPGQTSVGEAAAIEHADAFVVATDAHIRHGCPMACYRPGLDVIDMPAREAFRSTGTSSATEAYYATLLHELTHWSGAPPRLDRRLGGRFGSQAYAMEELVAELGAAFLCADLGLTNEPRPDHAAYLASWLTVLRSDRRAVFIAARLANEAALFLEAFSERSPSA